MAENYEPTLQTTLSELPKAELEQALSNEDATTALITQLVKRDFSESFQIEVETQEADMTDEEYTYYQGAALKDFVAHLASVDWQTRLL